MNPEAQRIAIAEACGYVELMGDPWRGNAWLPKGWTIGHFIRRGEPALYIDGLPDYLNDLDAMKEVILSLSNTKFKAYCQNLSLLVDGNKHMAPTRAFVCATAAQKAEAYLRAINKWNPEL